jgi:hypothetical protein
MKIKGRAADFCGAKEKREENEGMISMGKKANAFFFPGSHFLFPSPSFFMIFTEKRGAHSLPPEYLPLSLD